MIELQLLKHLLNHNNYLTHQSDIDLAYLKESSIELYYVYTTLDEMHGKFAKDISLDELIAYFYSRYPDCKKELYEGLFDQISKSVVAEEIAADIFREIKQRKTLLRLSELAFAASQGRNPQGAMAEDTIRNIVQITDSLRDGQEVLRDQEPDFVTTDLEDLLDGTVRTHGLRWRLDCLNKSLGSLRQGDFGFIFARPESGKTTFLASECSKFLDAAKQPIVWFNNEEQGSKVMLRIYQGYFGVKLDVLLANAAAYKTKFRDEVGERMLLVDNASIDRGTVERIVSKINPALVIFDQIDKVKGFKADRDDLVYGAIYQWARELAKTYAPTIGVCQADGTAEGQKWLSMANVSNAKTSKQAEADWILGIGKTHDQNTEMVRYLNISKNKLAGDSDSISELRHGRFEVIIQPEIARYQDIVKYG